VQFFYKNKSVNDLVEKESITIIAPPITPPSWIVRFFAAGKPDVGREAHTFIITI
jgi:hypothetical protein